MITGLTPSLLREASYRCGFAVVASIVGWDHHLRVDVSSIRIGAYEPVKAAVAPITGDGTVLQRALAGGLSGAIGSAIACPTDLIKANSDVVRSRSFHAYMYLLFVFVRHLPSGPSPGNKIWSAVYRNLARRDQHR
jgi:hypothetical protein